MIFSCFGKEFLLAETFFPIFYNIREDTGIIFV